MKIRPSFHQRRASRQRALRVENLEFRRLMVGDWTRVQAAPPEGVAQTMLLLTDGNLLVQTGANVTKSWARFSPDAKGDYANGSFTPLASMGLERLYYPSTVLPSGKVFLVGGEYSGSPFQQNYANSSEIYDPVTDRWTPAAPFPEDFFGDTPSSLLPNGKILAGSPFNGKTYLYDPVSDTWTFAADKLRSDPSVEESWIALPNGNVLSYDVWGAGDSAQVYDVATNQWTDTGPVPVNLALRLEIGAGLQLPDGRIFQIGATNQTALYDPVTNSWQAGPQMPEGVGSDDAPAVALPNGHILFVADTPSFQAPSRLYEYDPTFNRLVEVTPPTTAGPDLTSIPSFITRLLALPNGHVLLTKSDGELWDYAPDGAPAEALRPTIASINKISGVSYELKGTRLNGYSEGAAYGDDAQMSSNYPIVQLTDANKHVFYAKTYNWTPGLTTDNRQVSTRFDLPAGLANGTYQLRVIANGIASAPANFSTLNGLSVQLTSPGADATVSTRLTSFTVRFNAPVNRQTLQASDLKINGRPANRVQYDAAQNAATFTYTASPITSQGSQSLRLAAGSIRGLDGSNLPGYSSSFRYDTAPLEATRIAPSNNGFLTVPSAWQDFDVTFSEAVDAKSVGIDDFWTSLGTVTEARVLAGGRTVRYRVTGLSNEGPISVVVNDGSILDRYGNPAMRGISANYRMDFGTRVPVNDWIDGAIQGADVHIGRVSGTLQSATDTDGFVVKLAAGELLSVHIQSDFAAGLRVGARMLGPNGAVLANAIAELAGDEIFLPGVKAPQAGQYRVEVFGVDDTQGTYQLRLNINAELESEFYIQGKPNPTPRSAQNLDPVFMSVGSSSTSSTKASVLGENFDAFDLALVAVSFETGSEGFSIDNQTDYEDLGLWHLTQRRGDEPGHSSTTSFYYGNDDTGTFETGGANAGSITSAPIDLSPHGQLTLFFNYVLQTEAIEGVDEASVSISIDGGTTYVTLLSNANTGQLPETSSWQSMQVDLTPYAGKLALLRFNFDTWDDISNEFEGWYVDDVVVTHVGDWNDYFSFTAQAGQSIDAVVKTTTGDPVLLDLEDIEGRVLTPANNSAANFDSGVQAFIAPTTGTYYVRIHSAVRATYELLVTKDAMLETAPNGTASTANVLHSGIATLGFVATEVRQELDFTTGLQGVVIDNSLGGAGPSAGLWHLTERRGQEAGHSGTTSFYYGSDTTGNYNTGAANAGSFTTPSFAVPAGAAQLTFNYILNSAPFTFEDVATVAVSTDNFLSYVVLLFSNFNMPQANTWQTMTVDLSTFAGQSVSFRFSFSTVTALFNDYEGWYVDDIAVSNGQRPDWYSITLGADQTALQITMRTPGNIGSQFPSSLNPKLELFDSTGTRLIARGTLRADGRNEVLNLSRLVAGTTYLIRVSAEANTRGQYVLDAQALRAVDVRRISDDDR